MEISYRREAKAEERRVKEQAEKLKKVMLELKRMFGDNIIINHDDIQLSASCLGGFQYIPERGEYVEGECSSYPTTSFKVEKELIRAESTEKEIILYEMVIIYFNYDVGCIKYWCNYIYNCYL